MVLETNLVSHYDGAFKLEFKSTLNENLGGILSGNQC